MTARKVRTLYAANSKSGIIGKTRQISDHEFEFRFIMQRVMNHSSAHITRQIQIKIEIPHRT